MEHTTNESELLQDKCDCPTKKAISYLGTSCSIKNRKIDFDLFRKATDRNQYLLPSSIHPATGTNNVPFSLALRIVRTCTNITDREKRLKELKEMFLSREYPERVIDPALDRARKIPRKIALMRSKNKKESNKRPVFAIKYDPRLPSIPSIQAKHWRAMDSKDQYLAKCFPEPPLTAFKGQTNLKELLIIAKFPGPPTKRPTIKSQE